MKKKEKKINSFLRNHNVNLLFPQLQHIVWHDESELQQKLIEKINNEEDVFKQYLTSTRKLGNLVQEQTDLQVPMTECKN